MATVVSITNPLTGSVEQVDKLDHTAQQIDDAVALAPQLSNPNLLDNWYFGNPVNQRGQTEYAVSGYNIDRWKSGAASDVVKVENGVLSISMTALYQTFFQIIENPERYSGETLTVSVLVDSIDASNAYQLVVRTGTQLGQYAAKLVTGSGLFSTQWKVPDGCTLLQVVIQSVKENAGNISIKAAKLELGSQQTLAHQDADGNWVLNEIPDYGEQLLRCQRYFQLYSAADKRPAKAVDCRPVMRADPSQGTIAIGGTTYYYNTAEL